MMKKTMLIAIALAVALSATVVWAGLGPQYRAQNQVQAGTCTMQQAPGEHQNRIGTPQGYKYGPGDGTGYEGDGPKDGTGYGKKAGDCNLSGTCDGTGPHGKATKKQTQAKRPR